jgi:hypothetical protein
MGYPRGWIPTATVAVSTFALIASCSPGQDKSPQGSLSVKLVASRPFIAANPLPQLVAAKVTISEIEARKADGSWVPSETHPPATFDLAALNAAGMTLPSHLLPEGQYSALQLRFSRVELGLDDGGRVPLPSPPTGWVVRIPADFSVVTDRATVIGLSVEPAAAFKFGGGHFEFDPDVRFDGVLR